ncbi:MAG: HPr family phosphocarrier protein [Anaerolineales bacterium]|jgi:phosphotransferase system HPr (HPr) family protein
MEKIKLVINNPVGLHARPATLFVSTTSSFDAKILAKNRTTSSEWVDAKSILMVLTLGVEQGHEIEVLAEGEDEKEAINQIKILIENNFPIED